MLPCIASKLGGCGARLEQQLATRQQLPDAKRIVHSQQHRHHAWPHNHITGDDNELTAVGMRHMHRVIVAQVIAQRILSGAGSRMRAVWLSAAQLICPTTGYIPAGSTQCASIQTAAALAWKHFALPWLQRVLCHHAAAKALGRGKGSKSRHRQRTKS